MLTISSYAVATAARAAARCRSRRARRPARGGRHAAARGRRSSAARRGRASAPGQTPGGRLVASSAPRSPRCPGWAGWPCASPPRSRWRSTPARRAAPMGSTYYPVNFTNTSAAPCGMYGYPGMSFVTAASSSGAQIGAAAQENPSFGEAAGPAARRRRRARLAAGRRRPATTRPRPASRRPRTGCGCTRRATPWPSYVDVSFSACASASTPLLTVMPVRSGQGRHAERR